MVRVAQDGEHSQGRHTVLRDGRRNIVVQDGRHWVAEFSDPRRAERVCTYLNGEMGDDHPGIDRLLADMRRDDDDRRDNRAAAG